MMRFAESRVLRAPTQTIHSLAPGERPLEAGWLNSIDFGCAQQIVGNKPLSRRTGTPVYMVPPFFRLAVPTDDLLLQVVDSALLYIVRGELLPNL